MSINMRNEWDVLSNNSMVLEEETWTSNSTDFANSKRHVSLASQIVLTLVYICGVIGNISALVTLFYKDKRRNKKHLLMLRCLAANDLVALLGMLLQMYVTIYAGSVTSTRPFCSLRIVWRLFGLFSGCVAIVMAAERWLALTRPFLYQKRVTIVTIVRCMAALWIAAFSLTILPLFGFGVYYENGKCIRYRDAMKSVDVAYAYLSFSCGTLLCLSIVCCNLAVSRVLRRLGRQSGSLRRVSRSSARSKLQPLARELISPPEGGSTAEERAFARLMALLSISFVICWMPQMISIPLAQYSLGLPETEKLTKKIIRLFHIVADILLCFHFTLDPYIYVLLHMRRSRIPLMKYLCRTCLPARSRGSSFTGTTDQHGHSGEGPPTPITELPSTAATDEHQTQLLEIAL